MSCQLHQKSKTKEVITFISEDLEEGFKKWRDIAFEVQVGLHELLGHGSGKLLQEVAPGEFNFPKDLDVKVTTKPNETWGSAFGQIAGSYEECRAELVALYLILSQPKEVLPILILLPKKTKPRLNSFLL